MKEKAKESGINIRDVVEKALEKAKEEKEKEELKKLASDIEESMKGVSEEEWVEAIRRSRDESKMKGYLFDASIIYLNQLINILDRIPKPRPVGTLTLRGRGGSQRNHSH